MNAGTGASPHLERRLSRWDAILLCVGGIIGSAIFLVPRDVARQLPSAPLILLVWIVGGAVSLVACFAAAELGAMFPQAGGAYIYLREAYGDFVAFLYGWMTFTVYNSGGLAALSVAFASYFGLVAPAFSAQHVLLDLGWLRVTRADLVALATNALLTWINVLGVKCAAVVLNVTAWMK